MGDRAGAPIAPVRGRLRIGLLLDSFTLRRWEASVIEEILAGADASIELVILNRAPSTPRTLRTRIAGMSLLPWSAYVKADAALFGSKDPDNPFALVDARELLRDVPVREVRPLQKRWTDRFPPDDLQAVRDANLDVMLRLGFRILKGEILDAARYGIWSIHHDDNRQYRGGPALFWEMYERNPESGTILQVLTEQLDAGKVIYRSTSSTDFTSFHRNRSATYWKTARFFARRLRDLRRRDLEQLIEQTPVEPYTRGVFRTPGPAAMLRFGTQTAWHNLKAQALRRISREQWYLAFARRPKSLLGARPHFTVLDVPKDRFYADPFVTDDGPTSYVFFEDYPYATRKAVISCMALIDGKPSAPAVVLERDYHLSYPAIFAWDGEWFMTPETEDNRTVELFRAVEFPWRWELDTVLMHDIRAVDPTIFRHQDRFWMYATVTPRGASTHDEVALFYADSIRGPWRPHEANPVVSDVRSARPAGRPFVEDGVLYRPGQNSARAYGHSITINRVDVLSETEYRETPVDVIPPSWVAKGNLCTHTLNASEQWLVTDGKRRQWTVGVR